MLPISDVYKNNYIDLRRRGGKIGPITGITKENINYRNELRHLDEIEGSIAVSISLSPRRRVIGLFMLHLFSIV
jgi:hypothetical protein